MKKQFVCMLLAIISALTPFARAEGTVYYVNPDGGRYYHAQRECVTVRAEYQAGMVAVSEAQLAQPPYDQLKPCNICLREKTQVDIPGGTTSFRYQSPYDTAEDDALYTAGLYPAGSVAPGVYTAHALDGCSGELRILGGDGQTLTAYALAGDTSLSFYLGDGMGVEIPANCVLRKIAYTVRFQTAREPVEILHARYMALVEMPGREYRVQSVEGTSGYFVLSTIQGELGAEPAQKVEIPAGQTVELNLMGAYDVFVEFVNCVVWVAEEGVG